MRRVIAGVAVLVSVVVVPPADAQTYYPHWSPETVEVAESSGKVVLTLVKGGPGHVRYRTEDGSCRTQYMAVPPETRCVPPARAPHDYGAVSGEVTFTEAGSRKITIPIVDDDLEEGYEAFSVRADEVEGSSAVVWIRDDDTRAECPYPPCATDDAGEPAAGTTTSTTVRSRRPGSGAVPRLPPVRSPVAGVPVPPTTTAASPPADLEVALASGELRPGPGFELTSNGAEPATGEGGGGGGSAAWVALGLGTAAVSAGGVVWIRRRRRWSATRV